MTRTRERWSYSAGEWGRNRVRAFEHPSTGMIFLEFRERGSGVKTRVALGHRDQEAAKKKAEEVAVALREPEKVVIKETTLRVLFDNYLREVTPQKGWSKRSHDKRAAQHVLRCFGADRKIATLNRRDWDKYIGWRRKGGDLRVGRTKGRPVGNRVITEDLKLLRAAINWALSVVDDDGRPLLMRNPLHGLPYPREETPRRPIINDETYQALLTIAPQIDPMFETALVLANETGHRIGAISMLRWSDIDFDNETILWRATHDKIGFEHRTPMTPELLDALQQYRKTHPRIGDHWIFCAPGDPSQPCSRHLWRDWWQRGEALAEIPHQPGTGWHSLRRKFATEMKDTPLKDLCYLGGWKEPQTILKCYQRADTATMKRALANRSKLVSVSL
jgi:integrase